jgi:outer membrane protein assembly factor BamB
MFAMSGIGSQGRRFLVQGSAAALCILAALAGSLLHADEGDPASWSQFHGPKGAGIATGDEAGPIEFGLEKNLVWKTNLPVGHSSPCIAGDLVFVTAFEAKSQRLQTLCLDAATGNILWSKRAPAEQIEKHHEISNPATATPAADRKIVVVYFASAGLFAYDFAGNGVWTKPLPIAKSTRDFGSGTSPIVADGKAILDMHLDADSYLVAFDLSSGEEVWKTPRPLFNQGWSTPIVWQEGDALRVGVTAVGRFTAYDLSDGKEIWWVNGVGNQVCATPVVADDLIVISSAGVLGEVDNVLQLPAFGDVVARHDANKDGAISLSELPDSLLLVDRKTTDGAGNMTVAEAFRLFGQKDDQPVGRLDWEKLRLGMLAFNVSDMNKTNVMAVRTGGTGDVTTSHIVWQEFRGVPEVPSPLVYRDRVWMIKSGGLLTCLALADGKLVFQKRIGAPGGYYASPVAGGNRIYVASDDGAVTVLEASDKLNILARNHLPDAILATPAIVDGTLYVRTTKQLFAFR